MKRILLPLLLCFLSLAGYSQVDVTATAGTLLSSYATLGAAFTAINAGTHQGTITIGISFNTNETGPCVLNSGDAAPASYTSISIRPTSDGVSISGATTTGRGLIELNGADNVTIDGDNAGTPGTNRNLTITNTAANTVTFTSCIRLALSTLVNSANNNTFRNLNIIGSGTGRNISTQTAEITSWGVVAAGNASTATVTTAPSAMTSATTSTIASGQTITNLIIDNNNIQTVARGVSVNGAATSVAVGLEIKNNVIGNPTQGAVDQVWTLGITAQGSTNGVISGNVVRVEGFTTSTTANRGIDLGSTVATAVGTFIIENNIIERVINNNPNTYPACGINLQGTAANAVNSIVRNNFVYNCTNSQVTGTGGFGVTFGMYGIRLVTGSGYKIYHNTVHFTGAVPGATSTNLATCFMINVATVTGCDVRNNIFSNQYTGGNPLASSNGYTCIYLPTGATSAMNLTMNNNALFQGSTPISYIGHLGTTASTNNYFAADFNAGATTPIANFRAYTSTLSVAGTNDNASLAFVGAPAFVSATDLHLQPVGANLPLVAGATGTGVATDIDGTTRSGTQPVIGAHEVNISNCTGTPTPGTVVASAMSGCGTFTTNLSTVGTSTGSSGIEFQWQTSPDGIAPYGDITGATTAVYTATVTTTAHYRARVTCSFSGFSDNTPGVQIVSNPVPASITGGGSTCVGGTLDLESATSGGTWISGTPAVATVDLNTGVVTGVTTGTATITYTITATGCTTTDVVTVNPTPSAIVITPASSQTVCLGDGATFTASATAPQVPLLTQSFNSGLAPWVVDNTGSANGNSPALTQWMQQANGYSGHNSPDASGFAMAISDDGGSGSITQTRLTSPSFSLAGYTSATLSFNHFYDFISSDVEASVQISTNGGGSWTTLQNYRTVGVDVGTATSFASASFDLSPYLGEADCMIRFFYSALWGWSWAVDNVSIMAAPPPSYTWTGISGADGLSCTNCATPTITPSATGNNVYSVTATASGCSSTSSVTVSVNPLPAAIGGALEVCHGLTTTLTNADGGGTWTSSNTVVATIGSNTGLVTGVSPGTATISYTFTGTGCTRTAIVTVNPLPAMIGGTAQVCEGATTTLTNTDAPGTWSSGNTSIATVGSNSGVVSGVLAGTASIVYTLPTGCIRTQTVSVNPLPVLTVTPGTPTTLCIGENTSAYTANATMPGFLLLNQNFNGSLNDWSIESVVGPGAGQWQIVPTGFDFTTTGDGTSMLQVAPLVTGTQIHSRVVSPSFSTVGHTAAQVTFNHYLFTDGADPTIAVEYSTDGGTVWLPLSSYSGAPGAVGSSTWTATTPNVSLALPIDATNQPNVKLRWNYDGSSYGWFIDNIKVSVPVSAATYAWTGGAELSCTTCTNPTITPTATGMNVYTVTATSSASCASSATVSVSVNPLPAVITGTFEVCAGLTTALESADAGGTWASSHPLIATVDASGIVTGQAAGTSMITYTLPSTCFRTAVVTVNPLPAPITGNLEVCEGLTIPLATTSTGGTWSSSNIFVADVDNAGVVWGFTAGTATITYMLPTGCITTAVVTVNALPAAITGNQEVCEGLTYTLSSATTGGTWTSGATGTAGVGSSTGLVTGVSAGNAMITYMLSTGCIRSVEATVNPLPAVITGNFEVCEGLTTALASGTLGGNWTSSNGNASVDGAGLVTGNNAGVATITYQLPATGCIRTQEVTVNALPSVIVGVLEVCEGLTTTLNATPAGGMWNSNDNGIATVDGIGVVTGHNFGVVTITYQLPVTGCIRTAEVTVNALPAAITGNFEVCEGLTTMLSSGPSGGSWTSSNSNALVDGAGIVTGNTAGLSVITYELPATGCIRTQEVTVNALPSSIAGNPEVCEGLTTLLSSTPGGGVWGSSDPATASVAGSGLVTGHVNGVATITYELPVTGCIRTLEVTVNALPATIAGASQVCATSSITLMSSTLGGSWTSSDDAIADVDMVTGVVSGITAGTATITYTLPTTCIATHSVTVNALPVVHNVTGGGSYCFSGAGVNVGLDNSETDNTYNLYLGSALMASQSGTGGAVDFGPMTAAGDYTVVATSSASCNRDMNGMATVTIIPLITPSVTLASVPGNTICAGTSVTFTASPVNGGTTPAYSWMVNSIPVTTTTNVHTYNPADGDVVTVTMTSNEACPSPASVSASEVMNVISNETPTVAITTPDASLCQGSMAFFTVSATTFSGTSPVYTWYKNNVSTGATGSTYTYVPVDGDIISARMNSNYMCPIVNNVESNKITMDIDSVHVPIVSITTNTGLLIKPGQSVIFTATVTKGGLTPTYQWFRNSALISGATSRTHTLNNLNNNDSISCVVYGTGQCSWYTFNAVKMKVTTGFDAVSTTEADIRLMPNPNSGEFAIKGTLASTNDAEVSLEITDMLGQVVYRNKVTTRGGVLNEQVKLSNTLANGMYMLNVISGTDRKAFHFVLKQ